MLSIMTPSTPQISSLLHAISAYYVKCLSFSWRNLKNYVRPTGCGFLKGFHFFRRSVFDQETWHFKSAAINCLSDASKFEPGLQTRWVRELWSWWAHTQRTGSPSGGKDGIYLYIFSSLCSLRKHRMGISVKWTSWEAFQIQSLASFNWYGIKNVPISFSQTSEPNYLLKNVKNVDITSKSAFRMWEILMIGKNEKCVHFDSGASSIFDLILTDWAAPESKSIRFD